MSREDKTKRISIFTPDKFGGVNVDSFPIETNNLSKVERLGLLIDSLGLGDNLSSVLSQFSFVGGLGMTLGSMLLYGPLLAVMAILGVIAFFLIALFNKDKRVGLNILLGVLVFFYCFSSIHLSVNSVIERRLETNENL